MIAGLIHFALHLVQITDFTITKSPLPTHTHYNRASSMFCGWFDTGSCGSFTNSLPHIDSPIWAKDFELWFVSPKDFILQDYCPVFVCLGSLEPFDIVLLLHQWFLDRNSAIYANFSESSPNRGCWHIFFMRFAQLRSDDLSIEPSVTQAGDKWNCLLHHYYPAIQYNSLIWIPVVV